MRKSNFALRLQPSLLEEARKLAEAEGVALNQLINVAVAEKLSALRTADYFTARAARADIPKALKILKRAGSWQAADKGRRYSAQEEESKTPSGMMVQAGIGCWQSDSFGTHAEYDKVDAESV